MADSNTATKDERRAATDMIRALAPHDEVTIAFRGRSARFYVQALREHPDWGLTLIECRPDLAGQG